MSANSSYQNKNTPALQATVNASIISDIVDLNELQRSLLKRFDY